MDVSEMNSIFKRGGGKVIDFLNYCVISAQIDPVFIYLVEQEYKSHCSKKRATALYDVFCASAAPMRVNADQVLPPSDKTLEYAMQSIRLDQIQAQGQNVVTRKVTAMFGARKPEKGMFDEVVDALRGKGSESTLGDVCKKYDPTMDALANLGGEITSIQRSYIRSSWTGAARPVLVAAGFKVVATMCGGGT